MKTSLICFICSTILLFGCAQKDVSILQTPLSGVSSQEILQETKEVNLTGDFSSVSVVSGTISSITFSGKSLIYNGLFSISIPESTKQREYLSQENVLFGISTDRVEFMDRDPYKSFSLNTRELTGEDYKASPKGLCTHDYNDILLSKSNFTKTIKKTNIYVTDIKLRTEGLDVAPRISQQRAICFVYSGALFAFSVVDYSKQEMQTILNSLHFY